MFFGEKNPDLAIFENLAQLQCCSPSLQYCMRVWCKLIRILIAEKYAEQQHPVVCGKLSCDDMLQDVCQLFMYCVLSL